MENLVLRRETKSQNRLWRWGWGLKCFKIQALFLDPGWWWFLRVETLLEDPGNCDGQGSLVCYHRSAILWQESDVKCHPGSVHIKKLPQLSVYVCSPWKENLCRLISLILLIKTIYKQCGCCIVYNDFLWHLGAFFFFFFPWWLKFTGLLKWFKNIFFSSLPKVTYIHGHERHGKLGLFTWSNSIHL